MVNFNNPQKLNLSSELSTVSATLDNPFLKSKIPNKPFSNQDNILNDILPKRINLGITSPGSLDMPNKCTGLVFNTNNNVIVKQDTNDGHYLPKTVFKNFVNNLDYTFSALTESEKEHYIEHLKTFIKSDKDNNKVEHFTNTSNTKKCSEDNSNNYSYILFMIISSIILIIFIIYIIQKIK